MNDQPILPHQSNAINRILDPKSNLPGLILAHGLGSGKTRSGIEAISNYLKPGYTATAVLPVPLVENFKKEVKKWHPELSKKINIIPHSKLLDTELIDSISPDFVLVDEAHRYRNKSSQISKNLESLLNKSKKSLLLTATPIYNSPADLARLVNLASHSDLLPESEKAFERKYPNPISKKEDRGALRNVVLEYIRQKRLSSILNKYVDYYKPGENELRYYPHRIDDSIRVKMSPTEEKLYAASFDKALLKDLKARKLLDSLKSDKKNLSKLLAFFTGVRTLSNTTNAFMKDDSHSESPKIDEAFKRLKSALDNNPRYKAVVYSNFLDSGLNPYINKLKEEGIPYASFTGETKDEIRKSIIDKYNKDKIKVLALSSAGGEGLDLKGTRLIQVLEPHFNNEKLNQVIGRAIRYKSHSHLPKDEQNVKVETYSSFAPNVNKLKKSKTYIPESIDDLLKEMSDKKTKKSDYYMNLLKTH